MILFGFKSLKAEFIFITVLLVILVILLTINYYQKKLEIQGFFYCQKW